MMQKIVMDGITFDDVLLIPQKSEVLPYEVDLKTKITPKITLKIPFMSAAMDTVTNGKMAIMMAQLGGVGVIHKNFTVAEQVNEVQKVKKQNAKHYPEALINEKGQYIVGAAVSTGDNELTLKRVQKLIDAGVDFIVVDSAHGHSAKVISLIKILRTEFSDLEIIAGNIATTQAAKDLVEAGANAVKVGIGPGSICTTRVIAGVGVPQISALLEVGNYCLANDIPYIADGGIKYSGDVTKALGAGASAVMLGNMLAGTIEAPGELIDIDGQTYKTYVGMGSIVAMKRGSSDRYFQKKDQKLVPEGIESIIPTKGSVADVIYQLVGGLRSGMGYTGNATIQALQKNAQFVRITNAGLIESHTHDVRIFKQAPNYRK